MEEEFQFDEHIFQMGWNQQAVDVWSSFMDRCDFLLILMLETASLWCFCLLLEVDEIRHLAFVAIIWAMSRVLVTMQPCGLWSHQVNWSFSCSTTTSNEAAGNKHVFRYDAPYFCSKDCSLFRNVQTISYNEIRWSSWRFRHISNNLCVEKRAFFQSLPCSLCLVISLHTWLTLAAKKLHT